MPNVINDLHSCQGKFIPQANFTYKNYKFNIVFIRSFN